MNDQRLKNTLRTASALNAVLKVTPQEKYKHRRLSQAAIACVIENIVQGQSDAEINAQLVKERFLLAGDKISERQMYRYRAMPEAKPDLRHMTLRAQQIGSAAYSNIIIQTIQLEKAAIAKLLILDETGNPMMNPEIMDSRSITALSDIHFKVQDIVLKLFSPDPLQPEPVNMLEIRAEAVATLAEELARSLEIKHKMREKRERDAISQAAEGQMEAPEG